MQQPLKLYNTIKREVQVFEPFHAPYVGMYVCGPTVYGDAHLGHARAAITYDLLYRYLSHSGYRVRYVRNITDVGHLENDADDGEDKIVKKARLEELEPMEVVQFYINRYHEFIGKLNVLPPGIEPLASGHIIEQIQIIEKIFDAGFAYESNGSVYFDVLAYSKKYHYGELSGRVLEDLLSFTRELDGKQDKRNSFDFALWKKAGPEHIMKWPSKWSTGFPGWHLECSAMSIKYLGDVIDIHGGGMDLIFPHHECEIAQSKAAIGYDTVRYWVHMNMITIDGQKMSKSLGNFITLEELFTGNHKLLEKAYSPMSVRFFILQAHYRSTLDFSNSALQASEAGLQKIFSAVKALPSLIANGPGNDYVKTIQQKCYNALNEDLNSALLIAEIYEAVRLVNSVKEGHRNISPDDLDLLKDIFSTFVSGILGLTEENSDIHSGLVDDLINILLNLRQEVKLKKDFQTSDKIRDELAGIGVWVKDRKDGFEWGMEKGT
jgi:cysteinyl-tRNA synthetase